MSRLITAARARALRLFKSFHGNPVRIESTLSLNIPENLIKLGRAVAIVYECDKKNGGGDGKRAVYEHEFETPVGLYMDESARRQLYIIGPKIVVTDAGIEN